MKNKILSIVFIATIFLFGISLVVSAAEDNVEQKPAEDKASTDDMTTEVKETVIYYTCPMNQHKHIHSDSAGTCNDCNMALVAAVVTSEDKKDYYGCPMLEHSHVRSDQPGTCADCGMELKPMRLVKN